MSVAKLGCAPAMMFAGVILVGLRVGRADPGDTGQTIYQDECARCHGKLGEGTKKTSRPLVGEKPPGQLFALIKRTMPDDDPGALNDDQYRKVTDYIEGAFYSPDAQARLHPPRVELSHLTVGQYRNTVADLIGSFRSTAKRDDRQGLHAVYFTGKENGGRPLIDRIDPQVNFDFGADGPKVDSDDGGHPAFDAHRFRIHWEGSVQADETGDYEFVVKTEQAFRLWVNDPKKPLIDGFVKSGEETQFRSSIFLLGGRPYPVRLEFYKGRQFDDKKPKNEKPKPASIALQWRPPRRQVDEIIPARCLNPGKSTELSILQTSFPPDDRSYGWERGASVSKEWFAATTEAALETAGYVADHLRELSGVSDDDGDRAGKLRDFCRTFARRAFRRPLTDAELDRIVDHQFDQAADLDLAVKRSILRVMIAPEFLYPSGSDEWSASKDAKTESFATAARLALILWDSTPDAELESAAESGNLSTRDQIAAQARRMIADPRAEWKMRQFLFAWLRVDQPGDLVKDAKKFPDFDPAMAGDLRTSLALFLHNIIGSDDADFRQLLLSNDVFVNGRLARFYGVDLPADSEFTKESLPDRAGVLTQPYLLSNFAYPDESSPIHRGVFIIRGMLGVTLRPPANASFTPLAPSLHPDLTTRQRVALQTNPENCIACHGTINPLGFALEDFDAVGRHRDEENGKQIDLHGSYETRSGSTVQFNGSRELAEFLASSDEARGAFAQQMFQQFVKQPVRAYGLEMPGRLNKAFADCNFNIRKLLVEIALEGSAPSGNK